MQYEEEPNGFGLFKVTLGPNDNEILYIVADEMVDALLIAQDMTAQMPDIPYVDKIEWLSATVIIQKKKGEA